MLGHFGGLKIVLSPHLTNFVEDWSDCRSRSRAERRRRQGHKQRVKLIAREPEAFRMGDTVFVDPETYARLMKEPESRC